MLKLATLTMALVATAACAHAATPNLCENPSQTAKRADVYHSSGSLVFPSDGADYSSNPAMVWDISGGKTEQFEVHCYPNDLGMDGAWTAQIPKGTNGCTFLEGVFTCN